MRPPICATLFPYTTLFRSRAHLRGSRRWLHACSLQNANLVPHERPRVSHASRTGGDRVRTAVSRSTPRRDRARGGARSEEHTSELQSHVNLVCRLPLEKQN